MESCDVHPKIQEAFRKAGLVSAESILQLSIADLKRATLLTQKEVTLAKKCIAKKFLQYNFATGLDLQSGTCPEAWQTRFLTTGCPVLDSFLKGGIPVGGITEIAGESASGKTQLCLQLALTVQLDPSLGGLDGGTAYVCTEDAFPSRRLVQLIRNFPVRNGGRHPNYGENIYVEHVTDVKALKTCISVRLAALTNMKKIRLVIIDSVAASFRVEFEASEMALRAKELQSVGKLLHRLASSHGIAIVCVNQVTDTFSGTSRNTVPSLGVAWSNLVTNRFQLSRTNHMIAEETDQPESEKRIRQLDVLFSPYLPPSSCSFIVQAAGLKGIR